MFDNTEPVILWHHHTNTLSSTIEALARRYRHRRHSQVVASPVPVNYAHWYVPRSDTMAAPAPGDEIHCLDETVWTVLEANLSPLAGVWQLVCETYSLARPTEYVNHCRQVAGVYEVLQAGIGIRRSTTVRTLESGQEVKRATFFIPPASYNSDLMVPGDAIYVPGDNMFWRILRIERPQYRARWTSIAVEG